MNEIASFVDGEIGSDIQGRRGDQQHYLEKIYDSKHLHDPIHFVYNPGSRSQESMTICIFFFLGELPPYIAMNAKHYGDLLEVNVHNIYNLAQENATYQALKNVLDTPLPFILTRANFAGTGAFAAKWTGDNLAT